MFLHLARNQVTGSWIYRRWQNHACFMDVRIASKGLTDGTILALVPFFIVRSSKSFEQVCVPWVTENRYGVNNEQWGWRCEGRNLADIVKISPQWTSGVRALPVSNEFAEKDLPAVWSDYAVLGIGQRTPISLGHETSWRSNGRAVTGKFDTTALTVGDDRPTSLGCHRILK